MVDVKDYITAAKALRLDEGEWTEEDHPRDEKGMFVAGGPTSEHVISVYGDTYKHKDEIKVSGFKYNPKDKEWTKAVQLTRRERQFLTKSNPADAEHTKERMSAFARHIGGHGGSLGVRAALGFQLSKNNQSPFEDIKEAE